MTDKVTIRRIIGRQILDSRGNPTVEADVLTTAGSGRAAVPSGASTGTHEALELRDVDSKAFFGKGVGKAVSNINDIIAPALNGMDLTNQNEIDEKMLTLDGTENKSVLGANAILAVSLAAAKAAATSQCKPLFAYLGGEKAVTLPIPMMNVINGGEHAGNALDFQEFMIYPSGAKSFSQAIQYGVEIYHTLKSLLKEKYGPNAINVGDEGGFAPPINNSQEPLDILMKAIEQVGLTGKIQLTMDCAASEFFKDGKYYVDGKVLDSSELFELYMDLVKTYPIISIEDPFNEEDYDGYKLMTDKVGNKVQIVGDDLFVTNLKRLQRGIDMGAANALLLKVNQIGSLTESIAAANLSFENNYGVVVSHRSGETEDNTIADLAVALNAGQIKTGAPCRSDRNAKYNQLLRIEEALGDKAVFGRS